jgi:hypothetical protein
MRSVIQIFLLLAITAQYVSAQKKLPVLQASSTSVNIREGNFVYKNAWRISPELKPDIFVTNPFKGTKEITFFSNVDSLTFSVKPNRKYDFIISLNGGESAYTQINTDLKETPTFKPKPTVQRKAGMGNSPTDTLNFKLGKNSYIYLKGKVNNSDTLDFLFDTGAGISVVTSSLIDNKKVNVKLDGEQDNGGSDGISRVKTSSANSIEIGNLIWKDVPLLAIDYQGFPFDMVLGWVAFEGKIVEINYDRNILVVHNELPETVPEYSKLEMQYFEGVPYIKCRLGTNGKESEAWFDFDTGSDGTLFAGQKYASANSLNNGLKPIGMSRSIGSSGVAFTQQSVILPRLMFGDFELYQVPLYINDKDPEGVSNNEIIGNKILKRFNAILDFKNDAIYLKPNSLFYSPMY